MFVTGNRVSLGAVLLLMLVLLVTACGPPGPRALLQGRKHLEAGQPEPAIKELKTAVSLLPTNAAAWNYLGLAYHRAGLLTNAVDAYSRAVKLDRDLLEARFNLGCVLLDVNRPDAAKTELTAYTLRRGGEPEGWLKLGLAQLRAREVGSAEKSFREALRIETNNVEAWNGLGLAQLQRNRPREAAESFASALQAQPDYRPALLNLATVSQQQLNDRAEALRRYRAYLALQPRAPDWDAVNAIVQAMEQPAVVTQSQRASTTNPVSTRVPAISTNQSRSLAQPDTAKPPPTIKPVTNPVSSKPSPSPATSSPSSTVTHPPPEIVKLTPPPTLQGISPEPKPSVVASNLTPLANTVVSNSSAPPRTAERVVNRPSNPVRSGIRREAEIALAQGQQAQRVERDAEAFQFFRRATQLDPSYFEAYYCLGLTAFKLRNFQVARTAWESALRLRPNDSDARYNLALTLKAAGYAKESAEELEKLLSVHPDEARAHLTLGNLYADQLRDIPRARRHYNRVLQLDPRNPQAQAIRFWLVANPG